MNAHFYDEQVGQGLTHRFEVKRMLYECVSEFQKITIFENETMGRVMVLDGYVQTTTTDEHMYHEMLVHVPLFSHKKARRVLVIGGGDGGALRRCLEHPEIENVTMVEIDKCVIDAARKWMPEISAGAFDDPRCKLVVADGIGFVKNAKDMFDIIIIDSTDPVGAGTPLFTKEFYADCQKRLAPGGLLVTQSGVPFFQKEELRNTHAHLKSLFKDAWFFTTCAPSYYGGHLAFGWATDDIDMRRQTKDEIEKRFARSKIKTDYYNPRIHVASFAIPEFMAKIICHQAA